MIVYKKSLIHDDQCCICEEVIPAGVELSIVPGSFGDEYIHCPKCAKGLEGKTEFAEEETDPDHDVLDGTDYTAYLEKKGYGWRETWI